MGPGPRATQILHTTVEKEITGHIFLHRRGVPLALSNLGM